MANIKRPSRASAALCHAFLSRTRTVRIRFQIIAAPLRMGFRFRWAASSMELNLVAQILYYVTTPTDPFVARSKMSLGYSLMSIAGLRTTKYAMKTSNTQLLSSIITFRHALYGHLSNDLYTMN